MLTTLFVTDNESPLADSAFNTISFNSYLRDYPKLHEPKTRVINLCDTDRYLSQGYYCSLLAEARQHQVVPSLKVINALRAEGASLWFGKDYLEADCLSSSPDGLLVVCMGQAESPCYSRLAEAVYREYPAPVLLVRVSAEQSGLRVNIRRGALSRLPEADRNFCLQVLEEYSRKSWPAHKKSKKYRWDMAMLVNPEEKVPPSDRGALSRFVKAGEKLGIHVQQVTPAELQDVSHYDALFIRETTAIDHHTYRLARAAEKRDLVVMDDSDSILRCCNKVFLHDAFNYQKVPSLRTEFVSDASEETLARITETFGFPLILKMPEGSFSRGVFKVASADELKKQVTELLDESALVLAQEYMFTDYDWRIGVLNGRALYACRYYMARNHWQIYNHKSKRNFSGGFDALPTFEVPAPVLNAALKAAAVVGNGLYGIDIKQVGKQAYVLEVNDNPSIDHGVEDEYLGEELYMQIMSEFLRRLEARGR